MKAGWYHLWLLMAIGLLFSGCGKEKYETVGEKAVDRFESVAKAIDKHVDDKEKEALLLILVEENRIAFKRIESEYVKVIRLGRENPDINREGLEKLLADYNEVRSREFMFMAQNRMKMRDLLTEKQWNSIFHPEGDKKSEGGAK